MPNLGREQVAIFGAESSYGTPVTPAVPLGVVVGGSVREDAAVYKRYGIASKWLYSQEYGRTGCGCDLSVYPQALSDLQALIGRSTATSELASYTMDVGVYAGLVLPRRLVGAKCSSLSLRIGVDSPLFADISFLAQQVVDGGVSVAGPGSAIWLPEQISLNYGGNVLADLQSLEIEVNNNLRPKYLASRDSANPRSLARIDEGKQEITATITAWDRLSPAVRSTIQTHAASGYTIAISLYEPCTDTNGSITLSGCYSPGMSEDLVPGEIVPYTYEVNVGTITMA